ncbi:Chaoptin [Papilio xuthus]|uniref:Chaoptin n=1 Tax=Papilio xuthus TaxID=66420 RepID=A0A194QH46_PAPXU|nr:Chaoptin [Papilio xuthus]
MFVVVMVLGDEGRGRALQAALAACLLVGALSPEPLEPCARSPLCSCRAAHMSCIAVPLHRFPEWPRIELQHLDISMSNLEIIAESALDGLHLQTLVLVANRLHHIESHAFSSMANSLASLDLGYNDFTEVPHQGLKDLKVLNWLNLQNNNIAHIGSDLKWCHLEDTLTSLSLSNNQITELNEKSITSLKNSLEHLEVEHNKLSYLPDSLAQVVRLRHLSLAYNQFEVSPSLPSRIQTLSFAGNFLTTIPSTLHNIEAGNRIAQISNNVFPAQMPVKEINLSFNDLYYIHPECFSNLTGSLNILESSSTLFSGHFPFDFDEGLEKLSWLSFDNNDFYIVKLLDMVALPELKYLNLDNNRLIDIILDDSYNISLAIANLRLSYNFLSYVHNSTFNFMPDLRNLDLSYNRINNLTKNSFYNLSNLRYLSLANNIISSVEEHTFVNLPKLEVLELQSNNFTYFSLSSLKNVSDVHITFTLNISHNQIKTLKGYSFTPISILDGSYNGLTEVPNNFFSSTESSIRQIILSHNKITHIPNDVFGESLFLEILDVHKNKINVIKRKAFTRLKSLQILDFSFNGVTQLSVEQFCNLSKLKYLKMDHNNLRLLPRDVFKNTRIEHLDISYNEISLFPVTALSQVGFTLRYLDLSHNRIEYLDNNIFRNTQFLLSLNLRNNLLTVLSDNTFSSLGGLRRLDLGGNVIKANFKELFHNLPNLRYLNLANVSLKSVPYLPLANLTTLNLTSNYISSFKETDVKRLVSLRHLDVSHNRLNFLVPNMWYHLKNLNVLDISYNPIEKITINSFKWLSNLSYLNIIGLNNLDVIDVESFRPLISLRSIQLETLSPINLSNFYISNLTNSLPSLTKLIIHWTDENMDKQLHGIDARNIRYLEIKGERLKNISDDAFQSFASNHEIFIKITETSITTLPNKFMKHLGLVPQLGIDLSYNKIENLNPAIFYPNFTSWSHVATKLLSGGLILTGNPLRCECELNWLGAWLRRWFQENEAGTELRRAVRDAFCIDKNNRRVPLVQLRADEAECHASALSSDAQPNYTNILYMVIITLCTLALR